MYTKVFDVNMSQNIWDTLQLYPISRIPVKKKVLNDRKFEYPNSLNGAQQTNEKQQTYDDDDDNCMCVFIISFPVKWVSFVHWIVCWMCNI